MAVEFWANGIDPHTHFVECGYHNKTTDDLCLVQSESNFAKTKQNLSLVSHHHLYQSVSAGLFVCESNS